MSLIGFEGFDDNATGFPDQTLGTGQNVSGASGLWSLIGGAATKQAGQLGGSAMSLSSNATAYCTFNSSYGRLITGVRFHTNATAALMQSSDLFWYGDGTTHKQVGLSINATGFLFLWSNTISTVLATGATGLTANSWYYVELDATFHATLGSVTLRLNGSGTEASASSVNTAPSGANQCNLWGFNASSVQGLTSYHDDMYLVDPTTGSAPYTSMLGVCRVETLFPVANSAVTWTPNASTNVSRVQETTMDSDTTYNSTATTGQDTFTHGSLSSTPATIFAAAVRAVIRKDQTSNPTAQTILVSGPTTQAGAVNTQATTYLTMRDIYLNDPNTGSAWTATGINNATIGYNRTL
jgi:hypothetical protein